MDSKNIAHSFIIIIIFVLLYFSIILSSGLQHVKDNWNEYKCKPTIMPFASFFGHDPAENYSNCIQTMQSNYAKYLTAPMNYNLGITSNIGSTLGSSMNAARGFISSIRNFVTKIVSTVFGTFINILIEFQSVFITFKDIFGKMIGVLATLMFTLDGSIKTMQSTWNGPPGQLTRAMCFHPNTKIRLKNGVLKNISDISLNDTLKTGNKVWGTMQLSNIDDSNRIIENFYKIRGGENNEDILVTGSHMILDPSINKFVKVKNLNSIYKPVLTNISSKVLICLITTDHKIPIGEWIFHDWEDNLIIN